MMKRLAVLVVFASMLMLVSVFSAGAALADHTGGTQWTCNDGATVDGELCENRTPIGPAAQQIGPVGRNIADPARANIATGGGTTPSNFLVAINHNPLCPFHGVAGP